jgi:serine/threonine-protein kinase
MSLDTRLMDLLLRYEALREEGQTITPEELCRDYPELLDEVKRRITGLEALTPRISASADEVTPGSGQPATIPELRQTQPDWAAAGARSYRPLRFHAKGGMGEVFLAHDEELHREVALKRIQTSQGQNPESRRRFLQEAEVTARLQHPGVVPVYGLVQDAEGQPCYAMRFIEGDERGSTLADAIRRFHVADKASRDAGERNLALRQLLGHFVAVCKTVAYAHSRGILHRDIKPGNIMLGRYGETLLVDWGLAKPFERDEAARASGEQTLAPASRGEQSGTRTGEAAGTPAYMSPEQAAGRWDLVGPASDIYSLGATLYHLLTGQPPYEGGFRQVQLRIQRGDFPRPRHSKKEVPVSLERVCLQAMALEPADRYTTALALAADVEHWLADEPVAATRSPGQGGCGAGGGATVPSWREQGHCC